MMVFRDAGKSTIVGLYCAWRLLRDPNTRILVISAEQALACKMTRNVRRIIERHPATQPLLPKRKEQWAADQFTVERTLDSRDPSLLARGIGGNATGARADMIICDDVEVPNTCDTPGKRANLRETLREVNYVMVPGGTQLFIGTPHTYYSLYADEDRPEGGDRERHLRDFKRLVLPIYDENGASRWPERFTPEHIEQIRRQSGPAKFKSQMLLIPSHVRDIRLDPERLRRYDAPLERQTANGQLITTIAGRRMVGVSCFWDPALGRPERGDASVVAVVYRDGDNGYWLHTIHYLKASSDVGLAQQFCAQVHELAAELELPSVTVETNGVGGFLPSELRKLLEQRSSAIKVKEHHSSMSKDRRILDAFDPLLAAGSLHVHGSVFETPFPGEMREWVPGGGGRDDGLDAVAGCIRGPADRLRQQPPLAAHSARRRQGGQFAAITAFDL
jgi:hypothetical protein